MFIMSTLHSTSFLATKRVSETTGKMTESENKGGGKGPLEVSRPTFCSKQGQSDQVA